MLGRCWDLCGACFGEGDALAGVFCGAGGRGWLWERYGVCGGTGAAVGVGGSARGSAGSAGTVVGEFPRGGTGAAGNGCAGGVLAEGTGGGRGSLRDAGESFLHPAFPHVMGRCPSRSSLCPPSSSASLGEQGGLWAWVTSCAVLGGGMMLPGSGQDQGLQAASWSSYSSWPSPGKLRPEQPLPAKTQARGSIWLGSRVLRVPRWRLSFPSCSG